MKIKWYGTATISIETENEKILFDPFIPLKGSKIKTTISDFKEYNQIFITHGHFDHIGSLKKISKDHQIKIHCTKTPYHVLLKKKLSKDYLNIIEPNQIINLNNLTIKTYQGKHIEYDEGAIKKIILTPRTYKYFYNLPLIIRENKICQENNEILIYEIKIESKTILMMGSLGLDANTNYPKNCDLFIMPYQGKKDLLTPSLEIINKLKPKNILLIHFDDTFPPISKDVNISDLQEKLDKNIKLIIPKYQEEIIF